MTERAIIRPIVVPSDEDRFHHVLEVAEHPARSRVPPLVPDEVVHPGLVGRPPEGLYPRRPLEPVEAPEREGAEAPHEEGALKGDDGQEGLLHRQSVTVRGGFARSPPTPLFPVPDAPAYSVSGILPEAGAERGELLLDALIAAIHVVDPVDGRCALRREPRDEQCARRCGVALPP